MEEANVYGACVFSNCPRLPGDRTGTVFEKFFPTHQFNYFTCHSWLLDTTLLDLLPQGGNIQRFQELFEIVRLDPSDSLLGYVFQWKADRSAARRIYPATSLAKSVQKAIAESRTFYVGLGFIKK